MTGAPSIVEHTTSNTSAASRSPHRARLVAVLVALAVVYAPTVAWLFGRWTISVWHHAHGLFIPPLVGWLIASELKRRRDLPVTANAWGFALLLPALILHVLDTGVRTQLLSALSLVIALPGLSLLFLGWPRTRVILFPLLFTAFALPIPLALTEQIHLLLRQMTTALVAPLLAATGVSLFAQGTTISLANATVEVADACSGFSTLYAAMAFAFLLAYFTTSTSRRIMVLAIAAPVAVAANVLRMLILLHLVVWRGPAILDTFIHPLSGLLTFAVALRLVWGPAGRPADHLESAPNVVPATESQA
jgi:exosortase